MTNYSLAGFSSFGSEFTTPPGEWHSSDHSGPTIIVSSIQLQVDTTCPVVIDSLNPHSCFVLRPAPPTDPPTDVTVIAVVTCVILLLVVVTIVAAIVVGVAVFRRKQSKYKYVPTPHHHSMHNNCQLSV